MAAPSTGGCCASSADGGQLGWVARRVELHPGAVQHCFLPNKKNESLLLFLSVSICPVLSRSFFMERVTCAQAWRLLNISPSIWSVRSIYTWPSLHLHHFKVSQRPWVCSLPLPSGVLSAVGEGGVYEEGDWTYGLAWSVNDKEKIHFLFSGKHIHDMDLVKLCNSSEQSKIDKHWRPWSPGIGHTSQRAVFVSVLWGKNWKRWLLASED